MTRNWAPMFKSIQEAIRSAILAERNVQVAQLPAGLQGTDFDVQAAVDLNLPQAKPFTVTVLPPERTPLRMQLTNSVEASPMTFRLLIELRAAPEASKMTLLREVVGLIADALEVDPTLGGLVGGWADPGVDLQDIVSGPGIVAQEVAVSLLARS